MTHSMATKIKIYTKKNEVTSPKHVVVYLFRTPLLILQPKQ